MIPGRAFYSESTQQQPYTRAGVLAGRVIRISPAQGVNLMLAAIADQLGV